MTGLFEFLGKLKIPTGIIIGTVGIVSFLLIFLPSNILSTLGLFDFKTDYNGIIGIVFLVSFAIILLFFADYVIKLIKKKYIWHLRKKDLIEKLKNNYNVRELLESAYNNNMSIYADSTDSNIIYLFNEGVLFQPQQVLVGSLRNGMRLKYIVQPWATKIVKEYFEGKVK